MRDGWIALKRVGPEGRVGPGEWGTLGRRAIVGCPDCGMTAMLDHEVSASGVVTPSLQCPAQCGFHAMVVLDSWEAPSE